MENEVWGIPKGRFRVYLRSERTKEKAAVFARRAFIEGLGVCWTISERTRRRVFKKMGVDWDDPNPKVVATTVVRVVDSKGNLTFSIWP